MWCGHLPPLTWFLKHHEGQSHDTIFFILLGVQHALDHSPLQGSPLRFICAQTSHSGLPRLPYLYRSRTSTVFWHGEYLEGWPDQEGKETGRVKIKNFKVQRSSALYFINFFNSIPIFIIPNWNRSYLSVNKAVWIRSLQKNAFSPMWTWSQIGLCKLLDYQTFAYSFQE